MAQKTRIRKGSAPRAMARVWNAAFRFLQATAVDKVASEPR